MPIAVALTDMELAEWIRGDFPLTKSPGIKQSSSVIAWARKKDSLLTIGCLPARNGELWKNVDVLGGPGYRLPTEAEWEYACRAGTTTPFSFGETIHENQANVNRLLPGPFFKSNLVAVGSYQANAFGLYDMHGNVAEWCNDVYDPRYYEDCPIDDAPGPSSKGRVVVRGGCWIERPEESRSANRVDEFPWVKPWRWFSCRQGGFGELGEETTGFVRKRHRHHAHRAYRYRFVRDVQPGRQDAGIRKR